MPCKVPIKLAINGSKIHCRSFALIKPTCDYGQVDDRVPQTFNINKVMVITIQVWTIFLPPG